ncbi:MAG: hypothetical protein HQL35_02885 [Alphaproteobacteria bacterium]|nr:hypothetical protein [Alphaproteobacteria bacterium]
MSKISNALLSLFLDKKARQALEHTKERAHPHAPHHAPLAPPPPPEETQEDIKRQLDAKIDAVKEKGPGGIPKDRRQLIQEARRVHSAKQDVLKDLSPEQRLKLQVLAMKAMLPSKPGG